MTRGDRLDRPSGGLIGQTEAGTDWTWRRGTDWTCQGGRLIGHDEGGLVGQAEGGTDWT